MLNPDSVELEDDERKPIPEEYVDFKIMRLMGWDWWTLNRQPNFFIEQIRAFIAAEQRAENSRKEKNNYGR